MEIVTTNSNGRTVLPRPWRGPQEVGRLGVYYAPRCARPDFAPGLMREARRSLPQVDVVHASAAYHWFFPPLARACWRARRPLVVSPRGALVPRARGTKVAKKRLYEMLFGQKAFRRVAAFHATSDGEASAVRELVPGARVAVIPNGVEVPGVLPERDPGSAPFALYLGRLHPYKRVERIISAFARATHEEGLEGRGKREKGKANRHLEEDPTVVGPWSLIVAGEGEASYRRGLERVAAEAGLGGRVRFAGKVSGEEKARLLAGAAFVVQAPNPENFGNVVAEALAHGTPALVGRGLPWQGLAGEGCGFWVDDSEEALAAGMRRLVALLFEERRAMGERGRAWMRREFSWDSVARRMLALYEELVPGRDGRPVAAG